MLFSRNGRADAAAVEAASAELRRLADQEIELFFQAAAKRAALAAAEAGLGDAVMGGADPGAAAGELSGLRSAIQGFDAAHRTAHRRRVEAIGEFWKLRAAAAVQAADDVQAELAAHRKRIGGILEKLAEAEGVPAEELRKSNPVEALWDASRGATHPGLTVEPKSARLQADIQRKQWEAHEYSLVNPAAMNCEGGAEGSDLAELLRGMLADPTRITPPVEAVAEWKAKADAEVRLGPSRRYRIYCRAEQLDLTQCSVYAAAIGAAA